ncbi:MAG: glycosyltransferase [Actinomycetota bacterium]|nr:glycosyltransferase [Actinomycetota bacterium]
MCITASKDEGVSPTTADESLTQGYGSSSLRDLLTVVLLTYNCAHRIDVVLTRLCALGLPIIAVDNASNDHTVAVLRERPEVMAVPLPINIGAAGRNHGAALSSTPYVIFCDDDGWWESEGLIDGVELLNGHARLAVLNARILVGESGRLDPISAEMADSPLADQDNIPGAVLMGFMAGAVMVRRSAFLEVGGYDQAFFMGGEEETLAFKFARVDWHMRYFPALTVRHHPSLANAPHLRAHGMRNTLWNAWLHRRFASAVRWSIFILVDTPKNIDWLHGLAMTVRGIPWVMRRRRPMDAELDAALGLLDRRRFAARRSVFNRADAMRALRKGT